MYNIWSTVSIDLKTANISSENIDKFNDDLNATAQKIKEENKIDSIEALVRLYEHILTFYNSFENSMSENYKKLKEIKYNSIIAYENVETEKFEEAQKYITEAQNLNNSILNNLGDTNEYSIKKVGIILNQISSSLNLKEKDIFYINYRNLIEELNLI